MSKTDELLAQLKEVSKYNALNESFETDNIADRLIKLKKDLLTSVGLTNAVLDDSKMDIIKEVKTIPIDPSLRVVTYPNIHYEKKYNVESLVLFEFVLKRINEHANSNNRYDFNATEVVQEAISYTLKYLIGKTPSKRITIDEFKREYQLYAFGSYRKVQLYPNIYKLTTLAKNSPYIISYIDNKLLYRQINNLNNYSQKVQSDFEKLLRNDPSLKYTLNSYMSCIERSIRALVNIYKIIRNVFIELQNEYFSIFRQIIRVNRASLGSYQECCFETNNYIKSLNENIENLESSENDIDLESIKNTMGIEFINMIRKRIESSDEIINSTYSSLGLISKLDCNTEYVLDVPNAIYDIDSLKIKEYIDSINNLLNTCKDLSELSNKSSKILCDNEINDINELRSFLTNEICLDKINIAVNPDMLINSVMKLLSLVNYIKKNFYMKILNTSFDGMDTLDKCKYFKNIIVGILSIVDSIYFNIINVFDNFFNYQVKLLND